MDRNELLRSLEELMELAPGTLTGPEGLAELEGWNSMAVIGFIGLADDRGLAVSLGSVTQCTTVDDLLRLLGAKSAGQPA